MKLIQMADQVRFPRMCTAELRSTFLLDDLFQQGEVTLAYVDLDRTVIGSAVPLASALPLPCPAELRAESFTERRELGVLNIGGSGAVHVDGEAYGLGLRDAIYVGRGKHAISFSSDDADAPAELYLLSYPAHTEYPTAVVRAGEQEPAALGAAETANLRKITKLIHVWNTMPPHTHRRRSEVYFYFDLPADQRVVHLMGPAAETRHLVVANKEVVISPGWSIHAGVGTSSYSFCWGMGGENQVYTDMDALRIPELL
jgi:4-deoxy-L-threo-5-hexosulose-uronate ketol-isomerase